MFSFLFKKSRETGVCERALCFFGCKYRGRRHKTANSSSKWPMLKKANNSYFFGLFAAWCKKDNSGVYWD